MNRVLKGFRRFRGRIIPIFEKHPVGAGIALVAGAGIVGTKIRQKSMEKIRGKGKTGTGSLIGNFATDVGISYGLIKGAQKIGGEPVTVSLGAAAKVFKRAVRGF